MFKTFFLTLLLLSCYETRSIDDVTPTFIRSAIETNNWQDESDHISQVSEKLTYKGLLSSVGSESFPLRTAVEEVPYVPISTRIPLRDAVEYRPLDALPERYRHQHRLDAEQNRQARTKFDPNPFAAYIRTTLPADSENRPYRADNPYQQIVDAPTYFNTQQKLISGHEDQDADWIDAKGLITSQPFHFQTNQVDEVKANNNYDPKVFCHFTNWAFYREGAGKFVPENIDTKLCSYILYSFASLEPNTLTIKEFDPWGDIENQLYQRTTKLNSDVPVLLSIGGWTDSAGDKYSRLISSASSRKNFIDKATAFVKQHGFAGLHFDWNYPVCWQSDCKKGPARDKANYATFIEELSDQFYQEDLILTCSISGYKEVITEAYDLPKLSDACDYLTVMSYDYHGAWEPETGHIAPLYPRKGDKYPQYNIDYTMDLLVKAGVDKEKLILGVPFYGQSFTLTRYRDNLSGEGTPSSGPGDPGPITKQPGMLAYYEICKNIKENRWQIGRDSSGKSGPYAGLKTQWVGYDDTKYVTSKAEYVLKNGFGGISAWTIDLDDFKNECCQGTYPLLKAINKALGRTSVGPTSDCSKPAEPVTPVAPVMTPPVEGGEWKPSSTTGGSTTWPTWSEKPTTQRPTTKRTSTTPTSPTTTSRTTTTSTTTTRTTTLAPLPPSTQGTTIPPAAVVQPSVETCDISIDYQAVPDQCNSYYRCIYNRLHIYSCPGGLYWNAQNRNCDWPANVECNQSSGAMESIEQDEEQPEPSTTTTTKRPSRPSKTTRRTTTSKTTRPTTTTRTTTTRLTTTTRRTSKKTRSTTTTQRPQDSTIVKPKPTKKRCENGQRYPHKDCSKFFTCVNGVKLAQSCPPGLQWSQERKTCDYEENVRCVSKQKLNAYYRLIGSEKYEEDDTCEGNEFLKYWASCTVYLQCVHGQIIMRDCPEGLEWNDNMKTCDWPSNANCNVDKEPEPVYTNPHDGVVNNVIGNEIITSKPTQITTTKMTTTTTTPKPVLQPFASDYKLVCYFTNWAWYRRGIGKYTPDSIDTDLCTHIVYGFAVLDYSQLTIRTHDSWADIDNNFYTRVTELKNKGVKVTLALGGWNDSQGDKYSRLVRSPEARARFVRHAIEFLDKYGFEGLDLDWEYPVCWQVDCKKGFPDEKEGFSALVRELSVAFKPRGLLLSSAVSPSKTVIDAGYDVPELSKYFDWIAVMCYDYHGQWDKKTGHVAPLYYHPDDEVDFFNTNYTMNYWIELGAPKHKLVMGMPLYGQSFQLENAKNNGLNARAPGPGQAGEFTRAAGFLAYYEICDRVKNKGWTVVKDPLGRMGPYAYNGNQWVSFDDQETLRRKSHYIRSMGLGGGMIWALDLDDFRNRCGEGHHPLLRTIRDVLAAPPLAHEEIPAPEFIDSEAEDLENDIEYDEEEKPVTSSTTTTVRTTRTRRTKPPRKTRPTTKTTITTTTKRSTTPIQDEVEEQPEEEIEQENVDSVETLVDTDISSETDLNEIEDTDNMVPDQDFKVVCYFTNWAWYRQEGGKFLPEDIDTDLCTHIVYGFAVLDRDSLTIKTHDSWADIDNEFYTRVVAHKKKGAKVTVAIGGWNDSAGDKYSRLVRDPAARARFIKHVIAFIERYEFDGLDLDWEYPVCWQVDCTKGYEDEKQAFTDLVRELSEAFKPRGLLLSSAVSPSKKVIDAGYEVAQLAELFDWIAVMTYDYHGQWDKKTGHVAPMYEHPDDFDKTFNANFTINYWIEQGAPPSKLVMGIPMYGQSFSLADNNKNGLNSMTYGGGEAGAATRSRGFLAYYEICKNIREKGWTVVRDALGRMGPYAYNRDQWVSFDDIAMVQHKSEYIRAMGLGGGMIWALDLDDFRNVCDCEEYPLLKTINRVLRSYPPAKKQCMLESIVQRPSLSDETTQKPISKPSKPSRKPKPPRKTTTTTTALMLDEVSTTTRRPSRKPKPPKRTSTSTTIEPMLDEVSSTTTRRTRPTRPKRTRTTTTTTTTTAAPFEEFEEELEEEDEGVEYIEQDVVQPGDGCSQMFMPDENDCSKYYQCDHGQLISYSCPAGLHWMLDHCDWPQAANCQLSSAGADTGIESEYNLVEQPTTSRTTTIASSSAGTKSTRRTTTKRTKTTKTTTARPPAKPTRPSSTNEVISTGQYKVVCYFTNWAWYRPGAGKYTPDDIDTDLCTHIVYGFAVLNGDTLTIKTHDSWADIDNRFYERVAELKNKGVKVTLALGGWNDSLGDKYSRLVLSDAAIKRFVTQSIEFVEKYGFQGLDLDWEYPVCWQVDCKRGSPKEKQGFTSLVRQLSEAYKQRGLLLSSAVSPSKMVIDAGYEVAELAKYFDWIAVMTYDYHGQWDKKTGHVAPLYEHPEDDVKHFNSNFTINYWIEQGAPPSKLVMGVPMYGQSFGLSDQSIHGLNAKSYGPGEAGQFTRSGGFLAFYEICAKINSGGWTVVRDPEGRMGPYAYKGTQWVSYDDVEDVRRKARFMKQMNLGGGMIWALDLDDFRNTCGCGKHPLLKTLNAELGRISTQRTKDCT